MDFAYHTLQGHLLETWVATAWNFTPHIRSTQWPPSTSQSLINRNEADMRYLKFSAFQICLSIMGTQRSLTLCWFFQKLCVFYPQDQEEGPQEEPNSTSWAEVSQLGGQMRLARGLSGQILKKLPGFSASLGTMLKNLLILMLKKLFLVTSLNLCCSNLCPPSSSFCQAPLWTAWPCLFISPHRCGQAAVKCLQSHPMGGLLLGVPKPFLFPA